MIRRLFPHPWLSVVLILTWMLLVNRWAVGSMVFAVIVGVVVPIMTALVESNFSNPSGGDRDSVGMFQQRAPWGPYSVRHDPRKSVKLFINGGRGGQPGALDYKSRYIHRGSAGYGDWCQAVQVSAFPDRYQQRLGEARRLLRLAGVPLGLKKH